MSRICPACQAAVQPDSRFCTECGSPLDGPKAPQPPRSLGAAALPPLPELEPSCQEAAAPGSELLVEVETNRRHLLQHASLVRFRVTSTIADPCGITICMRLHGPGRFVEQETEEAEQCCQFQRRGDQCVFSFPFRGLIPGEIAVRELRVLLTRPDQPEQALLFELPDKSLFVQVSDLAQAASAPGIVISGGINLDFSQLREMYGADIKNLLSLQAPAEAAPGQAAPAWQPIRLRLVGPMAIERPDLLPAELKIALPGDVVMELVRVRPGEFTMGSAEGEGKDDERPAHPVRLTRDFYLGKVPVTQGQYAALMGANPAKFPLSPQHPVDSVSWEDAKAFCRRLHDHLGRTPLALGGGLLVIEAVGLPTEAQWEYACRAGTRTAYAFGDDRSQLPQYGWFDKTAQGTTQPVGRLRPNAWGLFDMHGNVWEWCEDWYAPGYPAASADDPPGPPAGQRRVLRGGSWSYYARDSRSASRHSAEPAHRTANYGFRVALSVVPGTR